MGMINDDTKREILAATDIVELIGRHVKLRRAGSEWKGLCPFHNEKTPSFSVSQARGRFHCFGCGENGDAISFIQKFENTSFPEALKILADRTGVRIVEDEFDPEAAARQKRRSLLKQLHRAAADWFHELLLRDRGPAAQQARDYLRQRGFDIEVAKRWKLGFAPPGRLFAQWARESGFELPILLESGLMAESNERRGEYFAFFRNRLMIPVEDEMNQGEIIAFSGRKLDPNAGGGKYINSPEHTIFKKSKVLFGLSRSKRAIIREKSAIVCEGQLDLITCIEFGVENVVASQGTAFTEQHAKILKRHAEEEVVLCFDADSAGYKAAEKSFHTLSDADLHVRVVALPKGEDPDSLIRSRGPDAFRELIKSSTDFFEFQIDYLSKSTDLGTTRGRVAFSRQMAASAASINNPVARDLVVHKVASRLNIPADSFRQEVERAHSAVQRREKWKDRRNTEETPPAPQIGSQAVRALCRNALVVSGFATFLRNYCNSNFLEDIPGTDLLSKIWSADFDAEDPSAVSLFIDSLPPELSSTASAMVLSENFPAYNPEELVIRLEIERANLLRDQIQTQLADPNLDMDLFNELGRERICLREEILDLERRLKDIPAPFQAHANSKATPD